MIDREIIDSFSGKNKRKIMALQSCARDPHAGLVPTRKKVGSGYEITGDATISAVRIIWNINYYNHIRTRPTLQLFLRSTKGVPAYSSTYFLGI